MIHVTTEEYRALLRPGKPKAKRKKNPLHVSESSVVNACIKWLWNHGCYVWRNNTGAARTEGGGFIRYGLKGSPDIIGMNPSGRFLGIECKSPTGGDIEPEQELFRERCHAKKGFYMIARGIDDLERRKADIFA